MKRSVTIPSYSKRFKNSIFKKQIEAHRLIQWNGFLANVEKMPDETRFQIFQKRSAAMHLITSKKNFIKTGFMSPTNTEYNTRWIKAR
jgi:hypothetical protein